MTLDAARLEAAIKRNDVTGVRELLRHATEPDRRACAKALRPLLLGPDLSQLRTAFPSSGPVHAEGLGGLLTFLFERIASHQRDGKHTEVNRVREEWNTRRNSEAFVAASLGLAGGVAAAVRAADECDSWRQPDDSDLATIAGVLADRRPPWLAELVGRKLRSRFDLGLSSWALARALVRLGAVERPDVAEYTTKMPAALCQRMWREGWPHDWFVVKHPMTALLADPGLLEDEVWRLFTVPDAAPELARCGGHWEDALVTLSERGRLDRGQLLDACLDAFTRDFAPNRVGWYVTFHDRMNPSAEEMAARSGRYLRLLAAGAKPGVSLGQKACGRLLEARLLAAEDFLAASGPALLFPVKSVAMAQLKLIRRVIAAQPPVTDRALAAVAVAFGHQRLDVQEAALGLIAWWGLPEEDPERLTITELATSLAPSLAREAAAAGLPVGPASPRVEAGSAPRSESPPRTEASPIAIPPLDDPDELLQLLTQLMEDASDALAVERAVAGAVRFCVLPLAQRARLAAPLIKRAEKRLREDYDGPFGGQEIASDIAGLTLAWGTGWVPDPRASRVWGSEERTTVLRSGQARTMAGVLTARIWEASALVASGRPVQLLAEPEFESGAISPERLLGRLASWTGGNLPRYDLEIALLRLMPEMDETFWSAWSASHPSSLLTAQDAYRQGLASLSFEPQVGPPGIHGSLGGAPGSEHVVVARVTEPPADPARSHCWTLLTSLSRPLRDFYRFYGPRWNVTSRYQAVVAAWPLLCPWQPELAAAHLLRPLSESLRSGSSRVGTAATAVGALSRSGCPLGEVGHLALLTGLASAEPYVRIAAAEVWAKASLDGRLGPELAADALVTGVTGGAFKLNRIADGLEHASHEAVAGQRIVETVFAAAGRLIPAKPVNLHLLLEIAARIGAVTGTPEPPGAITRLADGRSASRLAAAARHLSPRG